MMAVGYIENLQNFGGSLCSYYDAVVLPFTPLSFHHCLRNLTGAADP